MADATAEGNATVHLSVPPPPSSSHGEGRSGRLLRLLLALVVGVLLGASPELSRALLPQSPSARYAPISAVPVSAMSAPGAGGHSSRTVSNLVGGRGGHFSDGGIRLRQTPSEYRELLMSGVLDGTLPYTPSEIEDIASVVNASREEFKDALRGAQRPFWLHHLAVSSGMVMMRYPVHMVKAGLMHSTFGYGRTGGQGMLVDTLDKYCFRRRKVRAIVGTAAEYLVAMDQCFPKDDFNEQGMETLYAGYRANLLSRAQSDMTRLWLLNEIDEFDPAEQLIA